jgi:ABC-2 type transport system ATP-binding protein
MSDSKDVAIKAVSVVKNFKLPHDQQSSIKGRLINFNKRGYEVQHALRGLSFDIKKGEFFGIVGRNGSGKSTLLKLIAGIYSPNSGHIDVRGKLTPFIELGVGFNPELSGRDNVYLNGALLGFSRSDMDAMYDDIVEFAELERFMDQKLKNYSSGMQVRLAFSIAIRAKSDILLLDEVLAVGDAIFQRKCYEYFKKLKKDKATVIFVSHDVNALLEYCDRGILIENGEIVSSGDIKKVVNDYTSILSRSESNKQEKQADNKHFGTGGAHIVSAKTYGRENKSQTLFTESDADIHISIDIEAKVAIEEPIYGLTIFDSAGRRIFAANNIWAQKKYPDIKAGTTVTLNWTVPNIFSEGTFSIAPGIAADHGTTMLDHVEEAATFRVQKTHPTTALTNTTYKLEVN